MDADAGAGPPNLKGVAAAGPAVPLPNMDCPSPGDAGLGVSDGFEPKKGAGEDAADSACDEVPLRLSLGYDTSPAGLGVAAAAVAGAPNWKGVDEVAGWAPKLTGDVGVVGRSSFAKGFAGGAGADVVCA